VKKNVLYMLLSVFSIQGTAFLSQLILAGVLSTENFAIVRTAESTLQLLSTIAPWGMSLLVIRLASQEVGHEEQGKALTSYIALAGISALILAAIGALILTNTASQVSSYLSILIWIVVLTSLSRTSLNYFYGKEQFGLISVVTFVTSLVSLMLLVVLATRWQLNGWVASRYVTELIVLGIAIMFVRGNLIAKLLTKVESIKALAEGMAVSLSLVLRSAIENLPLLIFAYLSADQSAIATYGLCTLLITGAMVLPGSIISVLLPRYGNMQKNAPHQIPAQHAKYERIVILVGAAVALLLVGTGYLVAHVFSEKYAGLQPYLTAIALIVPVRAYMIINANVLFVHQKTATGTKINFAGAASVALLSFALYFPFGLWGVVVGTVLVEIGSALFFKHHSKGIIASECPALAIAVSGAFPRSNDAPSVTRASNHG